MPAENETLEEAKKRIDDGFKDIAAAQAAGVTESQATELSKCIEYYERAATELVNTELAKRNVGIANLIAGIEGSRSKLEAAHEKTQELTKALTTMSKVIETLSKLIGQLPK